MYSLREVADTRTGGNHESGQLVSNTFLGNRYFYIGRDVNREHWERVYSNVFENPITDEQVTCFGFVSDENGKCYPLCMGNQYYIMMPNGTTFERLV